MVLQETCSQLESISLYSDVTDTILTGLVEYTILIRMLDRPVESL